MEITFAIAILAAFALGAYIRQPFAVAKRAGPPPPAAPDEPGRDPDRRKRDDDRIQQLNNMLNYTGKEQSGED